MHMKGIRKMKLWVDDVRKPPDTTWIWVQTTDEAKNILDTYHPSIDMIDIDHDAGDYVSFGGDYIRILDYMEEKQYSIPIHIHSMNPVGVQNMRRIIQRNNWKEV